MMPDRALRGILAPMVNALVPNEAVDQRDVVRSIAAPDRTVNPDAVNPALPWQRITWYLASPAAGTNVAEAFRVPGGGVARLITTYAKTAPSSDNFAATVACTGWGTAEGVTIIQGTNSGQASRMTKTMPPGALVTLNVTVASGAAGVSIELFYAPLGSQ